MSKTAKAYGFLISAGLSLFSFSFAIAISFLLFAAAGQMSEESREQTIALNLAQNIVDESEAMLRDLKREELESLLSGLPAQREEHTIRWEQEELMLASETALSTERSDAGALVEIRVCVFKTRQTEPLLQIETKRYIAYRE